MLFKLLADEPKEDVAAAVEALKADYESRPGLQLVEVAGGYQIVTRPSCTNGCAACSTSARRRS